MNILDEVKTRLSITGTDLDGTIQGMIDDVISYCRSAGLKYTQLISTRAVGLIARGVADLWNYGAGNGKFSDIFQLRLNQMTLDAASLDHDVESQEKSVMITENGTTTVTPDDGYVLSSVTVDVNVPSKPEQVKSVAITENGTTEITPDEGHVLSSVNVDVNVPSKPEQAKSVTITENGTTEVTPDDGYALSSVTVDVNVPSKPEQVKSVAITENGTTEITPDEGHVLSSVNVDVNVPSKPEQAKSVTITENGTTEVTPDDGYALSSVNVDVNVPSKPEQAKSVTITENGTTEVTPDEGYALSSVSVSVDVAGGPGIVTIPPVSFPIRNNILTKAADIDLGSIEWAQTNISDVSNLFYRMTDLKAIKWGNLPNLLSESIAASYMFGNCESLETIDLSVLDVRYISNAGNMFYGCTKLKNIIWNNIKIRSSSLYNMFYACQSLETLDASFLDPEYDKVKDIGYMFNQCYALKTLDLSNLKTASITSASSVFGACSKLTDIVFEDGCFSNTSIRDLNFNSNPLSHDCAVDIFNKLATHTNSPSLRLSTTTKGYLTDDEIAIATGKGWVVS